MDYTLASSPMNTPGTADLPSLSATTPTLANNFDSSALVQMTAGAATVTIVSQQRSYLSASIQYVSATVTQTVTM
jgi:hypothetical protein